MSVRQCYPLKSPTCPSFNKMSQKWQMEYSPIVLLWELYKIKHQGKRSK